MRTNLPPSTDERLTALHAQLVDAVTELRHSDKWAQMLAAASRFTTYSPSNVLLIAVQRPDATRVAGIRTWNSLGRRVVKGEHGIAILAPCLYRSEEDEAPAPADSLTAQQPDEGRMPQRELRGFRVVHVFDISQTDGTPLPDAAPQLLTGDAPREVWDGLVGVTLNAGYRLERRTCPAGINGWTQPFEKVVVIDKNLEPAQAAKTLAHELGHIRADHVGRYPAYSADRACRGVAEVEAESIAYVVASHLGINPGAYSVPYVAGWADDLDVLRHHMSTVVTASQWILDDLDTQTQVSQPRSGQRRDLVRTYAKTGDHARAPKPAVDSPPCAQTATPLM